jgi:rhodanese-related sulfurtransferase
MSKKMQALFGLLIVFSMILSACAPAAAPVAEATEAAVAEVTEAPVVVTEAPVVEEMGTDAQALFDELVNSLPADKGYGTVKADKLNEELVDQAPFILDVREAGEIEAAGFIEGSVNIPVRDVLNNLDKLPALDEPIVVTCASGHRGGFVFAALKLLGYTNVRNLAGGVNGWVKAEFPVVTGSMPEAPAVLNSAAIVEDQALFEMLNGFLVGLPEGFFSIKNDKLNEELVDAAPVMIDIRTAEEFAAGYVEGAINLPMNEVFTSLDKLPAKEDKIVIYCASGHRGAVVSMGLHLMGYENVVNLNGGFNGWKAAGLPVAGVTDWAVTMNEFVNSLPADKGYGTVKADKLNEELVDGALFIVDVREAAEIEEGGFIEGSINIPVREVLANLDKLPAQDQPIIVTCASGHRGGFVFAALKMLGYTNVRNLAGGVNAWKKAEFSVVTGSMPEAPAAISEPVIANQAMFDALNGFLVGLPEGFFSVKNDKLSEELVDAAPVMIDIRTAEEFAEGHIEGAVNIPMQEIFTSLDKLPAKDVRFVIYCASGHRGSIASMGLHLMGYATVVNLNGGLNAWVAAELPVVK